VVPADSGLVPAGPFTLGVDGDTEPWSLDNERPAHTVDLPAFRIARVPVSNGEWQAFIDAGGYDQPHWWSAHGWRHRLDAGLDRPLFWAADGSRRRFGFRRKKRSQHSPQNEDARLRALQMLVAGTDRETIAVSLKEEFEVEDPKAILDALTEVQPLRR
jgi:formylglycine-generating enzyme required for sulfatase activity